MNFLLPNELSVRTEASGGDVAAQVAHGPGGGPDGRSRMILLMHGYDNSLSGARDAYQNFRKNFETVFASSSWAKSLLADVFEFFWPGDKAWPPLIHYLSYPLEIKFAIDSGKTLAHFLATLSGPGSGQISVLLIAHSLGNRVLLEMLDQLRKLKENGAASRVEIAGVCMMAAAVPVSKVDASGPLRDAIDSKRTRSHVLYSPFDRVLQYAFPPGETLKGDAFWPTAIGREGQPRPKWDLTQVMPGYGHSDYWKRKPTVDPIARFLGQPVANHLQQNTLAKNTLGAAELSAHSIVSRAMGSR